MAGTNLESPTPARPELPRGDWFTLNCDGGARGNPGPAAIGVVLQAPDGQKVPVYKLRGRMTNNEAELDAVDFGLWLAAKRGARKILVLTDSKNAVEWVNGRYEMKARNLKPYLDKIRWRLEKFDQWAIRWVPREMNVEADALVNMALDQEAWRDGWGRA